ncbi:MAG TPA: alpha/beta hydrolase [Myxococcales bacterium]|jgi:pimeloyl-ACP methyl ester carboxylesterase
MRPRLASLEYSVLGRRLHACVGGEGPTVLLVHGLGATSHIWERFDLPGYRLVAVDLPGCGWSETRVGPHGPRELGLVLDALMDQLVPDGRIGVVGHSMGALAAVEMALTRPERIAALALLDVPLRLPAMARLTAAPLLGEAVFRVPTFAPASRTAVRIYLTWLFGDHRKLDGEIVDAYSNASSRPHYWETMLHGLRGIAGWAGQQRLPQLKVPSLVVWGQKDPMFPVAVGRQLAGLIPGADFVPLAGCGHSPPEEAPAALSDVVLSHFERRAAFGPGPRQGEDLP